MGWRGRVVAPGYPQHVIHRGNNRQDIFFADGDFERYLAWLGDAARRHDCAIHAYVLMTNHIHLLVTPNDEDGMPRMMQSVGRRYSGYVNARYGRTGTLWEGRYRSCVVDSDRYLFTCARYIELNPVRAGLVRHPAGYRWSSYHHNAQGRPDPMVTPHALYRDLGAGRDRRAQAYRALFETALDAATLGDLRAALHKGWPLGDDGFRARIGRLSGRPVAPRPRGRPPRQENSYQSRFLREK